MVQPKTAADEAELLTRRETMPGIVGLMTRKNRQWAEAQLLQMLNAQRHESFYSSGTWADESLGVYVGWTVLGDSSSERMPVFNQKRTVSLVFSGEEYSEQGTAGAESQAGRSTNKGYSRLLDRYAQETNFPAGLNGLFHGLVMDQVLGKTTLFNDRYGMHRLHYHESKEAFYFAAEAKAILAACPTLRTADLQSLGEFVSHSCVLENRTIFKEIKVLPAGSIWTFCNGEIRKNTYFSPKEWEDLTPLDSETYYAELRQFLSQRLSPYFDGGKAVGVALTGGLDTRVIMAWHNGTPGGLPCYTFGSMFRDSRDVQVARRVAKASRQSHHVITVGPDFLARFPHYAERSVFLTEGGLDVSRSSDLYVSEKAREFAPVKVVGTYGSEILRRAIMFKPVLPQPGLYHPDFLAHIDQARHGYPELLQQHPVTFAAFRQSPWYHRGVLALEQSQLEVRSPYLDNAFVRTVFRAPRVHGASEDVRSRLVRDGNAQLARIPTDRGSMGSIFSMLSRKFQDFMMRSEYAYDYGMPQWLARVDHILSSCHLERIFLGRHKLLHFRVWYRDSLANYVRQILLDPLTLSRPHLERKGIEAVVRGHLSGGRNYTTDIHKLLSLELLHRLFLDGK